MSNKQMTISETAFSYHVRGYNIIPVRKDKRPVLPSWKKWQTEVQSDEEILSWFNDKTNYNVAIITGKISGLTIIDIDVKGGQAEANETLKKFPKTFIVRTPSGGYHLYYKYAPGFTVSANAYPQFPNVDIRSDGGFVVACPSILPNGMYEELNNYPIQDFPVNLFPKSKPKKSLTEMTTASKGNRNDTAASFAGKLLQASNEKEWENEVWPAVERANKTYSPPLPDSELRTVFDSIVRKEKERRSSLILSPIQIEGQNVGEMKIRKNGNKMAYQTMANVFGVLESHPYFKGNIKFNTFRQEIEYNGKPLEDADIVKIQHFLQTATDLHSISKDATYSAILHYASENKYDEAQDFIKSLTWDGTVRLPTWLCSSLGVDNSDYHRGIGAQWLTGIIRRIMEPGCIMDYVLVLVGPQGIGKTSFFRIIGGKYYKSYTGNVESKDFYLTLRGCIILDLDEGATLYKSEAIKIKSIITCTEDEFRAPYDRVVKKYPRRFVFSLSTNDTEPFRDVTGNRRYWPIDSNQTVNFKWLEDNRDQLFAEAYHYYKNKTPIPEVSMEQAAEIQAEYLPDDSWTELVVNEVKISAAYCEGDPNYSTTILEVFQKIFQNESVSRLDRKQEMRIASIFKKELGLVKIQKMIEGERKNRWYISPKKLEQLQAKPTSRVQSKLDELVEDLKEKDKQYPLYE